MTRSANQTAQHDRHEDVTGGVVQCRYRNRTGARPQPAIEKPGEKDDEASRTTIEDMAESKGRSRSDQTPPPVRPRKFEGRSPDSITLPLEVAAKEELLRQRNRQYLIQHHPRQTRR